MSGYWILCCSAPLVTIMVHTLRVSVVAGQGSPSPSSTPPVSLTPAGPSDPGVVLELVIKVLVVLEDMEEVFHNMAAEEDLRVNAMFLGRWVDSQ
ncbi:unnamed protein product [Boreogadus saida]